VIARPAAIPQRIVSTAPSVTEILFALDLGDRVVGVSSFCRYPSAAAKLPKVGTFLNPNLEPILGLRPDLVIVIKNPIQLAERLGALNVRVLEVGQDSLADIETSTSRIGEAAGVGNRAAALNATIRAGLDEVRRLVAGQPRRRLAFLVGRSPGELQGMVAVGRASYLTELIELAGGVNVFAEAPAAYPKVSLEEILARDPEVIVDMGEMADTAGVTEAQKRAVVALWGRYPALAAVRSGRVHAVADDIFVVPGPRVAEAARAFARLLHPAVAQRGFAASSGICLPSGDKTGVLSHGAQRSKEFVVQ
jgi:iron complex transport system substrate-binding protein